MHATAAFSEYTISSQYAALAPNAGGQIAYSARLAKDDAWEASVFNNQYLLAGERSYIGGVYSWRFPVCLKNCWWKFFAQTGAGISNAGPIGEITWGTELPLLPLWLPRAAPRFVPALRLDVTSQFILIQYRAITWSYPIWAGISIPF